MKSGIYRLMVVAMLVFLGGCSEAQNNPGSTKQQPTQEELIQANRERLKKEREEIRKFIKNNKLNMKQTGSGMYYMLLDQPSDTSAQIIEGDRVEYTYIITMLDGTPVANSDELGNKAITVGKENAEIGLHEAFVLGYIGCRMVVILPSHLAHGISQNEYNVPPHTTLLYELKPLKKIN